MPGKRLVGTLAITVASLGRITLAELEQAELEQAELEQAEPARAEPARAEPTRGAPAPGKLPVVVPEMRALLDKVTPAAVEFPL